MKAIDKICEIQRWLFEKTNKINKILDEEFLKMTQINNFWCEKGYITLDSTNIKRM